MRLNNLMNSSKTSHISTEGPVSVELDTRYLASPVEEDIDARAERSLQERPSFSIRARLTLGFILFFFLSAAAILTVWYTVYRLEQRLHFLELADQYTFEIQQARRFEKNYFLCRIPKTEVIRHLDGRGGP